MNKATLKFAFIKSLPVLFGYLFLGTAFGIMLYDIGYNWIWAVFISFIVYAGSGQFLLVSLLSNNSSLTTVAVMSFFLNSRHIFYGLSFIDTFKKAKWREPFLIFSLTDETYSINLTIKDVPKDVDEIRARHYLSIFDHAYWIMGSFIGSIAGQVIPLDFTGIDFSMTALFVVIFIDLLTAQKGYNKCIGFIGVFCAIICLIIFGADKFILPTMILIMAILSVAKPVFDNKEVKL